MSAGDPARDAWRAMRDLVHSHDRRQAASEALGMSFGRVKLLRHLLAGPSTLRKLAEGLGVDPPYATVMADDLERRGLVRRVPHPMDRRAKLVQLTAAGRRAARRAERVLEEPPPALRTLDPTDLARLAELLARVTPSEADPPRAAT